MADAMGGRERPKTSEDEGRPRAHTFLSWVIGRPVSKVSRLKERPAWCSRQAGIVKAQDQGAGQLVAVQAHSLGSRGAAGSENRGGLGAEARSALQPLARVPRRLHHRGAPRRPGTMVSELRAIRKQGLKLQ